MSRRSPKVRKSESPEGSLESKVESPKSEDSPVADGHAPAGKKELQTENRPLQNETMEVHHHPEVEKKTLKQYLLEGLMIFPAVTMGFFAENLREHISDNHRESKFAKALYNELSVDSVAAAKILQIRLTKENDLDYLYAYFKDSSLTVLPRKFYPAFTMGLFMINSNTFEPKDGILSQLKNSGGMQYFKTVALQKLLGDLNVAINNIRYRNDQEYQFFTAPLKPFLLKYYDFNWLDRVRTAIQTSNLLDLLNSYMKGPLNIKAGILNVSALDRAEAANMMVFNKEMLVSTRSLQLNNYIVINHKILTVLRKTYTLEDE